MIKSLGEILEKEEENQNYDNLLLKKITPIKTADYQTIAKRPLNSRLSNKKLIEFLNN